jgi:hypothetical protein
VGLSPEDPPGGGPPAVAPPRKDGDTIGFIIGLVIGLPVGGSLLTLLVLFIVGVIATYVFKSQTESTWWLMLGEIPALALAWLAIVQSRKALNFVSGALIGLAAGLLGGTALCAVTLGGLSNMH